MRPVDEVLMAPLASMKSARIVLVGLVALAAKHARIPWTILAHDVDYSPATT
jgi:hypothetical protein